MPLIPSSNLQVGPVSGGGTAAADARDWLHELADGARRLQGAAAQETLSIAAGAVTPTRMSISVDTEGAAATDDLDTIIGTNLPLGSLLSINSVDAGRVVTVKHRTSGSGHIMLRDSADLVLSQQSIRLELQRVSEDRWLQRQRWYGSQKADFRAYLNITDVATMDLATIGEAQAGSATNRIMTPARVKNAVDTKALMVSGRAGASLPLGFMDELLLSQVANSDLRRLGLWALRNRLREPDFASGLLVLSGGQVTTNHGLGEEPADVDWKLVCQTADAGFSPGDVIRELAWQTTADNNQHFTVWANATQIGAGYHGLRAGKGGSFSALDTSRWRMVFRAWKTLTAT